MHNRRHMLAAFVGVPFLGLPGLLDAASSDDGWDALGAVLGPIDNSARSTIAHARAAGYKPGDVWCVMLQNHAGTGAPNACILVDDGRGSVSFNQDGRMGQ